MKKFLIEGPWKVKGTINISGSKNSALPILASTILFDKYVEIKNLPRVSDIETMLNLLRSLGSKVVISKKKNSVKIYNKKRNKTFASYSLVKTMRAGILVLGPLIAKSCKAKVSLPGGCLIGSRPVNYHLNSLRRLGMSYKITKGYIYAKVKNNLHGAKINFKKISVGASEQAIIASVLSKGKTLLKNIAIEPEVKDLVNFLVAGGAKIKWLGKRTLQIEGVKSLNSISYSVMGDRIECGTFCVAAAMSEGNLRSSGFNA